MYSQAPASPRVPIQPAMVRKPVPEEFGFGITTWPRKAGFSRSFQVVGRGRLRCCATTVLKQMAETKASIPVQVIGLRSERMFARSASAPCGV
jgi:hypothetical protein